jgi:hypothetical protein
LATPAGPTGDSRLSAARTGFGWSASAPDLADPAAQQRRALDRVLNISALAALGIFGVSKLVENEAGLWQLYQQAVTTSPIEAKVSEGAGAAAVRAMPPPPQVWRRTARCELITTAPLARAAGLHLGHGLQRGRPHRPGV